LNETKDGAADA